MKRDYQRKRVYDWECALGLKQATRLTLSECKKLVSRISKAYDIPTPEVSDGRGARRAISWGGRITLPCHSRSKHTVCHEMAHEIMINYYAYPFVSYHGPEFVYLLITLLRRYADLSLSIEDAWFNAVQANIDVKEYHV